MGERNRPAIGVQSCAEFMQAYWTIRRAAHVIFTRPSDLHGRIDRFRQQRGLDGIVVLESPPKASSDQRDIDLHLVGF